jgi:hypothetical protein
MPEKNRRQTFITAALYAREVFPRSGGEIIRFFERKKRKGKHKISEWSRVGSGVEWGSGRRRVEKGKTGTTTFLSRKP